MSTTAWVHISAHYLLSFTILSKLHMWLQAVVMIKLVNTYRCLEQFLLPSKKTVTELALLDSDTKPFGFLICKMGKTYPQGKREYVWWAHEHVHIAKKYTRYFFCNCTYKWGSVLPKCWVGNPYKEEDSIIRTSPFFLLRIIWLFCYSWHLVSFSFFYYENFKHL